MAFTKLYQYQKDYIDSMSKWHVMALDTGLGKSATSIAHYIKYAYPNPLLIVAPAAKIRTGDWEREVIEVFGAYGLSIPEVAFYSYEKLSRRPTPDQVRKYKREEEWREWLKLHPSGYSLILDECHKVANPQSLTGAAVYHLSKGAYTMALLSATPLPNGWISAANYFKIWGYTKHITDFKNRYCDIKTYKGFPEIVGYFREGELRKLWNSIATTMEKKDALDLPPLTFVPVTIKVGAEYAKVKKDIVFDDKLLDNPSAYLHALRQSTAMSKIPWLDEFIEGASGHTVIFYNYISERKAILEMLKKKHKSRAIYRQDGEKHELPTKETWGELPPRSIVLAQYQSGAVGVEMTFAQNTVFFAPQYSYTLFHQAIGRTYRNGQTNKCTMYLMCCPTTVENDVWKAIRNKKDFSEKQWIKDIQKK